MRFVLLYTRRALRDLESLDSLARKRIGVRILDLQTDPIQKSKKLIRAKIGTFRYRIGDYRVVFDIHGDKVIILRVGHRREIYR